MAAPDVGRAVWRGGFFDSHAHLADRAFESDRHQVIARARSAGADGIVCIGSVLDADDVSAKIAHDNPGFIFWTTGAHPHEAEQVNLQRDIPRIEESLARGAVAIGECGLDYHYDNSPRDTQRSVFEAQIELASRTGKPLIVHTRDAEPDTIAMIALARSSGVRGVLHCFTGTVALAEGAVEAGWFISFSGIVTFKAWKNDEVIRTVPEDRVLAESDAPYLAPVPNRGKRNEPAWVSSTVDRLALVRGITAQEMGGIVTANARAFFGLAAERPNLV